MRAVGGLRLKATVEVKSNLIITARERGKIVARRVGHNIWLNIGREYLAHLIGYSLFVPLTPERDDRIRYMGVGIGGNRQLALTTANAPPLITAYPGSNAQSDTDPAILTLERPVRISGSSDPYRRLARTDPSTSDSRRHDLRDLQAALRPDGRELHALPDGAAL
jgi:hypothetical protein